MLPELISKDGKEAVDSKNQAIEKAIADYTQPLLCGAMGLGFPETDAEELVQQTFVAFLSAIDRFEGRSKLKTYLFGILYNKACEMRRAHKHEEIPDDIDETFEKRFDSWGSWVKPPRGPEEIAVSNEIMDMIGKCSENLPLPQRMAFYLKEVEGETMETICNIVGCTPTHLGVLLFRARNRIRECLEKKWGKK